MLAMLQLNNGRWLTCGLVCCELYKDLLLPSPAVSSQQAPTLTHPRPAHQTLYHVSRNHLFMIFFFTFT